MSENLFGEVIFSYSRAQAIEDGELVDVTELAKEAGFSIPVALTRGCWADIADIPKKSLQDETGRTWDVLWMACTFARANRGKSEFEFQVRVQTSKAPRLKTYICKCGPGDNAEPVITIGYREDF